MPIDNNSWYFHWHIGISANEIIILTMTKKDFITKYLPLAQKAGEAFRINPVVILAQAAIETGWAQSDLCLLHHNFFGITAYGKKNVS